MHAADSIFVPIKNFGNTMVEKSPHNSGVGVCIHLMELFWAHGCVVLANGIAETKKIMSEMIA